MHFVDDRSASQLLYFLLLHTADETQPGRNSYPRLQFVAFCLGRYHVLVQLSFLHSNQPCFIVKLLIVDRRGGPMVRALVF